MKKLLAAIALAMVPTLSLAHSMSPGFEVEYAITPTIKKTYTLTNEYNECDKVFKVEVFNKDWTPADGWRTKKDTYKLKSGSKREIEIEFKADGVRKLLVCTTLVEIGKDGKKASIISRVCSRLIINDVSG